MKTEVVGVAAAIAVSACAASFVAVFASVITTGSTR